MNFREESEHLLEIASAFFIMLILTNSNRNYALNQQISTISLNNFIPCLTQCSSISPLPSTSRNWRSSYGGINERVSLLREYRIV